MAAYTVIRKANRLDGFNPRQHCRPILSLEHVLGSSRRRQAKHVLLLGVVVRNVDRATSDKYRLLQLIVGELYSAIITALLSRNFTSSTIPILAVAVK